MKSKLGKLFRAACLRSLFLWGALGLPLSASYAQAPQAPAPSSASLPAATGITTASNTAAIPAPLGKDGLVGIPPLYARVTDLTATLSSAQKDALEAVLKTYEDRRGSQIFVLLIPSTAPETIDAYSIRLAETWKAGRPKIDDGVILVVAPHNTKDLRRLRLEVGRGLEGTLTDAESKRILQDIIAPHFRANDFYGGLTAGVSAIQSYLDKEALPAPSPDNRRAGEDEIADWLPILFLLVLIIFTTFVRARRRALGYTHARDARVILGAGGLGGLGGLGGFGGGGFGGGGGGGDFGGGGGGFSGGGASGDW